jgi:iron complex transport system ATP-binding protein
MLKIQELTTGIFQNKRTRLLHERISVEIPTSSVTLLLGANGIGKSVFLKTLLNLHPSLSGKIRYNEHSLSSLSSSERSHFISLMLPTPPTVELMSCIEIVLSGQQRFMKPWSISSQSQENKVLEYFNQCQISHLANKNFAQLSDGEKQKVMLARCLAQETPIILLDEPMAFLDYPSRKHFLSLIKKIAQTQRKTIIVSTHDIDISLPFANQILAFSENEWHYFVDASQFNTSIIFNENS